MKLANTLAAVAIVADDWRGARHRRSTAGQIRRHLLLGFHQRLWFLDLPANAKALGSNHFQL